MTCSWNFRPRSSLLGVFLLLPALLLASGCSSTGSDPTPPASDSASASFSIAVDEVSTAPASRPRGLSAFSSIPWRSDSGGVSSLAFSPADISRIRIDVKEVSTGTLIYENFDLTKADNKWSGTLPFLPKGRPISFLAKAFDSSNTLLFSGSTDQSLTADNQVVSITLAPVNDNQTITLPRITRISIPAFFPEDKRGNISFSVSATTGEKLSYVITGASGGGSFSPQRGSITLLAAAGTFVSQYSPPHVTEETEFTHEVIVTNEAGHSVTTTFKTKVRPITHDDVLDPVIKVVFNPVINAIAAHRPVDTSDVLWKATVVDDAPVSELTYAWSFTANGTFDPAPEFTDGGATNPTRMLHYTPLLQGELKLIVTDAQGGKTTLKYALTPDQFPDDFYEEGNLGGLQTLSAGSHHTCVLLDNTYVRCWGYNNVGQLGYGNTLNIGDNEHPYTAGNVNLVGNAIQVVNGGYHTCALLDSGFVRCWGRNTHGQLGYGNTNNIGDNEAVWTAGDVSVGGLVKDIAAGGYHTCALLTTGKVRCWGYNGHGNLGYGNTTWIGDNEAPSSVGEVNVGGLVKQLSAGHFHTCALLETGNARCWGLNSIGQLGYGHTSQIGDNETPAAAGDVAVGDTVLQIVASKTDDDSWGYAYTCALLSNGGIKCWGLNNHGQLGYGNTSNLSQPPTATVDLGGASAYTLSAAADHTCALLSTGKARCWGYNNVGQLGYSHTTQIGDNELPSAAGDIQLVAP